MSISPPPGITVEDVDTALLEAMQNGGGTVRRRWGAREEERSWNIDALLRLRAVLAAQEAAITGSSVRFASFSKGT